MAITLNWVTSSGSLGTITEGIYYETNVLAVPTPSANVTYSIIAGNLPTGMTLYPGNGTISGSPLATITSDGVTTRVSTEITSKFAVRAVATDANTASTFTDRTFSFTISGESTPYFITPAGSIATLLDANLVPGLQIAYGDSDPNDVVTAKIIDGRLPPGLAMSDKGLISGYILPLTPIRVPVSSIYGDGTTVTVTFPEQVLPPFGVDSYVTVAGVQPSDSGYNGTVLTESVSKTNLTYRSSTTTANVDVQSATVTASPKTFYITDIVSDGNANITTLSFQTQDFPPYQVPQPITISGVTSNTELNNTFTTSNCTTSTVSFPGYFENATPTANVSIVTGINVVESFQFTVEITDGKTYNIRTFSISVINNSSRTADTTIITADNTYITADNSSLYCPVILNREGSIGTVPTDSYFAFLFTGYSSAQEVIYYEVKPVTPPGLALPPNLVLDSETGWLYGYIPPLGLTSQTFDFSIRPFYTDPTYGMVEGRWFNYSLTVEGNITEQVAWVTPSDLGSIDNGQISQLFVRAEAIDQLSNSVGNLYYRLVSGAFNRLPPGTELQSDGLIIGRVAFNIPSDITCTFTVEAYNLPGIGISPVSIFRTFTVIVKRTYLEPYENLYIKAMPPINDRVFLNNFLNDTTIFDPASIYRADDPNFGVAKNVVYWHAYGILPATREAYLNAMLKNHYLKQLTLGKIKTAQSRDDLGVGIYDVVYAEVVDNLVNNQGVSVSPEVVLPYPLRQTITMPITNIVGDGSTVTVSFPPPTADLYPQPLPPYTNGQTVNISDVLPVEYNGNVVIANVTTSSFTFSSNETATYQGGGIISGEDLYPRSVVYPNSLEYMRDQIIDSIGQVPPSSNILPQWMYSRQADGGVLGFTPAWVIAYTKPGEGDRIAYNISKSIGNKLNLIDFSVDRYEIDRQATYNFDPVTDNFIIPVATYTTFDANNHYELDSTQVPSFYHGTGYHVGDVLTILGSRLGGANVVNDLTISVAQVFDPVTIPNSMSGNGTEVTVFYATQLTEPYAAGQQINISNATPSSFNGNFTVTNCQRTQLTFTSNTTDVYLGNAVITGINTGAIAGVFANTTSLAASAGNSYANVSSTSSTGSGATFWITTVPGTATTFDQGSMQFTNSATPYVDGDQYDQYRVFPYRTILESGQIIALNWTNNSNSAVNWRNDLIPSELVQWVN